MMHEQLLPRIVPAITSELQKLGLKKRGGEIYTFEPAKGFLGWLGLNHAKRGNAVEINPVVGVRCQELEKLVATLLGEKEHTYLPPTISSSLGYLMPAKRYRAWLFENESDLSEVVDFVSAYKFYAMPFIKSSATLESIAKLLLIDGYGHNEHKMYRLPLVYRMLGKEKDALTMCQNYLNKMDGRSDLAAERFRRFVNSALGS